MKSLCLKLLLISLVFASVGCKKPYGNGRVRVLFKQTYKRGNASVLPQCQKPDVVKCSFIKVNKLFKRIKKKNVGKIFLIMKGISIRLKLEKQRKQCDEKYCGRCAGRIFEFQILGGGGVGEGGGTALFSHGSDNYYHNIMEGEVNPERGDPGQEDRHFSIESCNPLMSFTNNTEWQAQCKTRPSCNLLVEKKVEQMVKSSTEDNSDSTTESIEDGQADNTDTTTEVIEDLPTTEEIVVQQTNNIDNDMTTKIIGEDITDKDNVDRATKLQDDIKENIDSMWGRNTKLIEDDKTDNIMKTTTGVMENDEGITKGHGTPLFRSPNPNRLSIVTIKDDTINNENVPRDENNSSGETFSKDSPSTLLDQQGQISSESIPELISEKKTTNLAPEGDLVSQDTTPSYQSDAIDHTISDDSTFGSENPIFVTTKKISRILGGPKMFEDDKFSTISHSFKIFLQDLVNIISSAVKEKLNPEKPTFQFRESSPIKQNDLSKENGFVYDGDDYSYATSVHVQPSYDGSGTLQDDGSEKGSATERNEGIENGMDVG